MPDDTFAPIDPNDADLVGRNCAYSACNQLDFLPFLCHSCGHQYCLEHRTESAHRCARAGTWAERKREAALARPSLGAHHTMRDAVGSKKPCAAPECGTTIGTSLVPGVHCGSCNRDYCLQHRLFEDHDCKNLTPIGARVGVDDVAARAKGALDRLRAWGAARRAALGGGPSTKPPSASARIVALNKMKREASGDDKIDAAKRVYVYVEAEAATTTSKLPRGTYFYSRDWVVGRVLDAAAKSLQVENVNNQRADEESRLRVFYVEGGRLLGFQEKLGDVVVSGHTLVLLRGVGQPDLIEM